MPFVKNTRTTGRSNGRPVHPTIGRSGPVCLALFLAVAGCSSAADEGSSTSDAAQTASAADPALVALLPEETQQAISKFEINPGPLELVPKDDLSKIVVNENDVRTVSDFESAGDQDNARTDWQVGCLKAAGLPAELDPTGAIEMRADNIGEQLEATGADEVCTVEALIRFPLRPEPTTREEWQIVYDEQTEIADCLDKLGFSSSQPSLDEFIDNRGSWAAYDAVPDDIEETEWIRVNQECPQ